MWSQKLKLQKKLFVQRKGTHGTIKLSCPVALLQIYIQDILVDFMEKYPDINIRY